MAETTYTFDEQAFEAFAEVYDDLVRKKMQATNENAQGILSRDYAARIALLMHALEQAVEVAGCSDDTPPQWCTAIKENSVKCAAAISERCNAQKFIMLGLDDQGIDPGKPLDVRIIRLLSVESRHGDGVLKASDIAQKHLSEKVGSSYPISKAVELMAEAEHLGFGTVETVSTPNNRLAKRFRKCPITDLSLECRETLKKCKVSDSKYGLAFRRTAPSPALQDLQENIHI